MKTLSNLFYQRASWLYWVVSLALYGSFVGYLLPNAQARIEDAAGIKTGIIDLGFGFDAPVLRAQLLSYNDAARSIYAQTELTMDVAYPLVYTSFFILLISLLLRGSNWQQRFWWFNVLPLATFVFDLCENVFIVSLLKTAGPPPDGLLYGCMLFRALKWLLVIGVAVTTLAALGQKLFGKK